MKISKFYISPTNSPFWKCPWDVPYCVRIQRFEHTQKIFHGCNNKNKVAQEKQQETIKIKEYDRYFKNLLKFQW